ncbi:MAG: hypothetical protein PHN56_01665 [Candidatus Nanoarchaeia archaeon]|nr:hypothetical protein [Candidatus Nanoarchaeia archaeon]
MVIENLISSDKKFIESMLSQNYELHKGIMPYLFSLTLKNNRSALRRDYFFKIEDDKITYAHITGIIPPEIFSLKNLTGLKLQSPQIENLMTRNFTSYLEHGLKNVTPIQAKEHYQYLDFLCYYSCNEVKINDKENIMKIHDAVKHPEFYFPKATEYLCKKLNMNYRGDSLSFRHNSSEIYDLSKRIKSEFLLDLLLIDSMRNLKIDERIGNLENLSELEIERYEKVVFPDSVKKLSLEKLRVVSNQMIGLKNFKINLNAYNDNVLLANMRGHCNNIEDKINLYNLLIEGNDLKNYEPDSSWRKFKKKFMGSIPFESNPLE